jgi:hypothetical protein
LRLASQMKSWGIVWIPEKLAKVLKAPEQVALRQILEEATVEVLAFYLERILTPAGLSALQKLGLAQMRALVNGETVPGPRSDLLEENPGHALTPSSANALFRLLQHRSVSSPEQSSIDRARAEHRPLDLRGGFKVVDAEPAKQVGRWHGRG